MGIFGSKLDLDFQSINEKSNYVEVIKSTWSEGKTTEGRT